MWVANGDMEYRARPRAGGIILVMRSFDSSSDNIRYIRPLLTVVCLRMSLAVASIVAR